jgi:hypothetical protein
MLDFSGIRQEGGRRMTHLKPSHLDLVVRALPVPVRDLLQSRRVYLAGGFIRHHVAREQGKTDIDLFGLDFGAANEVAVNMAVTYANDCGVGMDVYDTPNAISLIPVENDDEYPVQFVHRWPLDTAEKIIEHFDFTICAAALWWDDLNRVWRSQVHKDFYADLDQQKLVYIGSDEPGGSLLRAFRYAHKGYRIRADSIAEIVEDLIDERAQTENHSDAEEVTILSLLREVDPLPDQPATESRTEKLLNSLGDNELPF